MPSSTVRMIIDMECELRWWWRGGAQGSTQRVQDVLPDRAESCSCISAWSLETHISLSTVISFCVLLQLPWRSLSGGCDTPCKPGRASNGQGHEAAGNRFGHSLVSLCRTRREN